MRGTHVRVFHLRPGSVVDHQSKGDVAALVRKKHEQESRPKQMGIIKMTSLWDLDPASMYATTRISLTRQGRFMRTVHILVVN